MKINKLFSAILVLMLLAVCIPVKAATDTGIVKSSVTDEKDLAGGVSYVKESVTTHNWQKTADTYTSEFQMLELGPNTNVQLVPWSTTDGKYSTSLVTLDKIAANYEKTHPGYKVIAGINAEGYWTDAGYPQISNVFMQEGNLMRTGVSSENYKELIGIRSDNTYVIDRWPDYSDNLIATLYDSEGNSLNELDVTGFNELPNGDEIAVITKELKEDLDMTGYYVIAGSYSMYRPTTFQTQGTRDIIKLKGDIYLKGSFDFDNTDTTAKAGGYTFYFITKSDDAYNKFKAAKSVICQYHLTGTFEDIDNIVGYMFKIVQDGESCSPEYFHDNTAYCEEVGIADDSFYYKNHSYMTARTKNRAGIGFKEDGSIVLSICTNGTQGPTQWEYGNILLSHGVNEAYTFDGGGSVTMIIRNENGGFDFMNKGADGSPRSISTGVFFVVKEPTFNVEVSRFGATITNTDSSVTSFKAVINGKTYTSNGSVLTIDGLKEGTKYEYEIIYPTTSVNGKAIESTTGTCTLETNTFEIPRAAFTITELTKTSIKFTSNKEITNVNAVIEGDVMYCGDGPVYEITGLEPGVEYNLDITYDVLDSETSSYYSGSSSTGYFTTLTYTPPVIKSFEATIEGEKGEVEVKYKITDSEKIVTKILIHCGFELSDELTDLSGKYTFNDVLDSTIVYLEVFYEADGKTQSLTSIEQTILNGWTEDNDPVDGCGNSAVSIISMISALTAIMFIFKRKN